MQICHLFATVESAARNVIRHGYLCENEFRPVCEIWVENVFRQQELGATIPLILDIRPLIFSYISRVTGETAVATLGTLGFFKLSQDLLEGFSRKRSIDIFHPRRVNQSDWRSFLFHEVDIYCFERIVLTTLGWIALKT